MKKSLIVSILLTIVFVVAGLTACSAQKEPTEENLEPTVTPIETSGGVYENMASDETDRATAYIKVINSLIRQYGEGRIVQNSFDDGESMLGVGIVRLIDFDGDGKHELYCAYADGNGDWVNKQSIYGYDNGLVELLKERNISNPGTDVSPSTTLLSKNGNVYLVDVVEIVDGNYFTVQDGKMVSVLNYYYDFFEDKNFTLNGADATKADILAAIEEMEVDGTKEIISFTYDVDSDELIKTQETIIKIEKAAHPLDNESTILYQNLDIGFTLEFPSSWEGKFIIKEYEIDWLGRNSIELYHKATMDEKEDAGWLGSFGRVSGYYTADWPPVMAGWCPI